MIKIPNSNLKFAQTNTGDLSGNVHITKNISFDTEGRISLAPRLRSIFDSDTYTDLVRSTSQPISKFIRYITKTWVIGVDSLYYITMGSTPYYLTLTKDATSGSPTSITDYFDGCVFNSASGAVMCVVTGLNDLYYYNGVTWTTVTFSGLDYKELVCVFENKRSLAVSSQNKIFLVSDAFAVQTTASLTLPLTYSITSMVWNNSKLYIGTQNVNSEDAMIFEWDGSSAEANIGYKVDAQAVASLVRYKDGCVAVTNNGEVLYVNGGTKQIATFPIYHESKQWAFETNTYTLYMKVLGMTVDKDKIYMGVDAFYMSELNDLKSDNFENNMPAGVWCYDPKVGLYNKYTVDGALAVRTGAITTANVNTTTNIITIPSSICPDTGTPVFYDDGAKGTGTRATPLENSTRYFVIKLSGTTLKLATTKADALAGTAIDITGTGNNVQTLVFCPNNGFGGIMERAGGVDKFRTTGSLYLGTDTFAGQLIVGGNVYKNDNSEIVSILSVAKGQENRGYEITPRIVSDNTTDTFQSIVIKHEPLINEDDKIIIKYRTTKPNRKLRKLYLNPTAGTWVNSTSFTTIDTRFSEVAVGDELEIISGAGAGYLAHITQIALDTGTYTVTIDETVENIVAGNTFYYTVDNWTKLKEITSTNSTGYLNIPLNQQSKWIQFKVELRGIDTSIEELQIINKKAIPSE